MLIELESVSHWHGTVLIDSLFWVTSSIWSIRYRLPIPFRRDKIQIVKITGAWSNKNACDAPSHFRSWKQEPAACSSIGAVPNEPHARTHCRLHDLITITNVLNTCSWLMILKEQPWQKYRLPGSQYESFLFLSKAPEMENWRNPPLAIYFSQSLKNNVREPPNWPGIECFVQKIKWVFLRFIQLLFIPFCVCLNLYFLWAQQRFSTSRTSSHHSHNTLRNYLVPRGMREGSVNRLVYSQINPHALSSSNLFNFPLETSSIIASFVGSSATFGSPQRTTNVMVKCTNPHCSYIARNMYSLSKHEKQCKYRDHQRNYFVPLPRNAAIVKQQNRRGTGSIPNVSILPSNNPSDNVSLHAAEI